MTYLVDFAMVKLKAELMDGRVFQGWKEGVITFAPTYKYFPNSDQYHGCSQGAETRKKRTPAWYKWKILVFTVFFG